MLSLYWCGLETCCQSQSRVQWLLVLWQHQDVALVTSHQQCQQCYHCHQPTTHKHKAQRHEWNYTNCIHNGQVDVSIKMYNYILTSCGLLLQVGKIKGTGVHNAALISVSVSLIQTPAPWDHKYAMCPFSSNFSLQDSHTSGKSWKVMAFKKRIFHAWKVMEKMEFLQYVMFSRRIIILRI